MADAALSCAHCSAQLSSSFSRGRPRKYCGTVCRDAVLNAIQRRKKGQPIRWADGIPENRKVFQCYVCEGTFSPKRAGRTKCCSRQCGFEWLRFAKAITNRPSFTVFRKKMVERVKAHTSRACPDCQAPIAGRQHRCEGCREKAAQAALARSRKLSRAKQIASGERAAARKARKLRIRGVSVEVVNPLKVLDRDGWFCQLCGAKTPKRLRGSYDDRAPEVDHIIPIAQGGDHSYSNTQCACRKCNLSKSSKPLGQMRLFG